MKQYKKHGNPPFRVVVIHGGPGVAGGMAPVALELSNVFGVFEPFQTKNSITKQIDELHSKINKHSQTPVILIGHSWGAWLSCMFASTFPSLIRKLILVSAGAFSEGYNQNLMDTRLQRLNGTERLEAENLLIRLNSPDWDENITDFKKFGQLMEKADTLDPSDTNYDILEYQPDIFRQIWDEAIKLRASGNLLEICSKIKCPVVAIHGDYDPHPFKGVKEPLSEIIPDFKFILLKKCGHYPWKEKRARKDFFEILHSKINTC